MSFQVVVYEPGASYPDGRYVVTRECGHKHRTERAAEACLHKLQDYRCGVCGRSRCRTRSHGNQRVWSAAWHRATVVAR